VEVDGRTVSRIGPGLLVFLGVEKGDGPAEASYVARKIPSLRIFGDAEGKMNLSVEEVEGEILVVSQFTLAAAIGKGRRPSFEGAAEPEAARSLYDQVVAEMSRGPVPIRTGVFGAMMQVHLVNDGPVTFLVHGRR
jgi:D-tyrosyl-tRNA(Tyr) deacylase